MFLDPINKTWTIRVLHNISTTFVHYLPLCDPGTLLRRGNHYDLKRMPFMLAYLHGQTQRLQNDRPAQPHPQVYLVLNHFLDIRRHAGHWLVWLTGSSTFRRGRGRPPLTPPRYCVLQLTIKSSTCSHNFQTHHSLRIWVNRLFVTWYYTFFIGSSFFHMSLETSLKVQIFGQNFKLKDKQPSCL